MYPKCTQIWYPVYSFGLGTFGYIFGYILGTRTDLGVRDDGDDCAKSECEERDGCKGPERKVEPGPEDA